MKLLIAIILTLFGAVWVALLLRHDPGYAMFSMGEWTVETSFAFFAVVLTFLFVIFYATVRLIIGFWHTPGRTLAAHRRILRNRAQHRYVLATQHMAAGQWAEAEKMFLKGAKYSETPMLHYLAAARAAHHLEGARARRDSYVQKAEAALDADTVTVQLIRAEFLITDQQAADIRVMLESLHTVYPKHPGVLKYLALAYQQLGLWEKLQALLPDVAQYKAFTPEEFLPFQAAAYHGLLQIAMASHAVEPLQTLWQQTPEVVRTEDEGFLINYTTALAEVGAADEAEAILFEGLTRRWSEKLIITYGLLERGNTLAQLERVEAWVAERPEDAYLLLTAGRVAKRAEQNVKARAYLERSIALLPTPEAYQELGELLAALRELTRAGQYFHAGLRLMIGKPLESQGALTVEGGKRFAEDHNLPVSAV